MSNSNQIFTGEKMIAEKSGSVGIMIFNNPKRHNALSLSMWKDIPLILDLFEKDHDIRVIVLKGSGTQAFISGADISEFNKERSDINSISNYDLIVHEASTRLQYSEKPTIAMIRGYCIGGGLGIAISCDIRIANNQSTFAIPAAKLGLGYNIDSLKPLVFLVGPSFAKEIICTARQFSSEEAIHMGLINRVVADHALDSYIDNYCTQLSDNAPLTISAARQTINEIMNVNNTGINKNLCDELLEKCFVSEDYIEGRKAFMEKRKPVFKGR